MTKLRLDQLRNRMNQSSSQIETKVQEEKTIIASIQNITNNYDKLVSDTNKEKEIKKTKELKLQSLSDNILDTKQQIDKETSLIEIINKYLGEHTESQQMPDIALMGIEDSNEFNQMTADVNQQM